MTRTMDSALATDIAASTATFVHLIQLHFSGGVQRISTGSEDLSWAGQTWTAVGGALGFNAVQESADLSAGTIELQLSGVDQGIIEHLLAETYIGRSAKVWLAHLDASAGTVIDTPLMLFSGFMNGGYTVSDVRPVDGHGTCTIALRCTDTLSVLDERRGFQTNEISHQSVFAGDRFFQHVNVLAHKNLVWKR